MADDQDDASKTEEPSPKRLREARDQGNVPSSRELISWFMLFALTLFLLAFAGPFSSRMMAVMTRFVAEPDGLAFDTITLQAEAWETIRAAGFLMLIPLGLAFLFATTSQILQVGFMFSTQALEPKLDRINPIEGFKRLVSLRALMEFAKGIVKLTIVGAVVTAVIWPEFEGLPRYATAEPLTMMADMRAVALKLLFVVLFVLAFLAFLDIVYQRYEFMKNLRMTKHEVKEEFKQTEGDPIVKNRLRKIRQERARKRMMAAVPTSDVVVTNPTHFAVALKYDAQSMAAPTLVAKGADLVAKRIRDVAEENDVPIVENAPLARALFAGVEIDEEIPPEHYQAVAEVIGYVMRLKRSPVRI
jgi:flagellar biosynthetic protein FlhB